MSPLRPAAPRRWRALAASSAAVVALLACAAPSDANALPDLYGGEDSTCFWNIGVVNGGTINIAYPDAGANYWAAGYTLPVGATLRIHGEYPHARFASVQAYDLLGVGVDALGDTMIEPDPGSANPFRPGVRRDVTRRSFTVTLADVPPDAALDPDQRAGQPPRNVLATKPAGDTTGLHAVLWRVYVPDRGRGLRGGVPLPEPELTLADGRVLTGFAGSAADAFALLERFEKKLAEFPDNTRRAVIELAKEWRTDRVLRRLEAMLAVADKSTSLIVSGAGDVIEPTDGVIGIGSGGAFAATAAQARLPHSKRSAKENVEAALRIAGEVSK
jgi:ATP-dependent protease HslVU peptidase subunit